MLVSATRSSPARVKMVIVILVLTPLLCNYCETTDGFSFEMGLEEKLVMDLLKPQSLLVRPNTCKQGVCAGALSVKVTYNIIQIASFTQADETLSLSGYFTLVWQDERLKWDKSKYGNVTTVALPANRIWLPDVGVINGKSSKYFDFSNEATSRVAVDNKGIITWMAGVILDVVCPLDVSLFPFDTQRCYIIFNPWQSPMQHLKIEINQQGGAVDNGYLPHSNISEWEINTVTFQLKTYLSQLGDGWEYKYIQICIQLTRQPLYFIVLVIVPYSMLSVLACLIYTLEDTGDRLQLALSLVLSMTMYFMIVATNAPRSMRTLPVLGIYLIGQMALLCVATVMAVVNNKLRFYQPPPETEKDPSQNMKPINSDHSETSPKVNLPFYDFIPFIRRVKKRFHNFCYQEAKPDVKGPFSEFSNNQQMQYSPSHRQRIHSISSIGASEKEEEQNMSKAPRVDPAAAHDSLSWYANSSNPLNPANQCALTPYSWIAHESHNISPESNTKEYANHNLTTHSSPSKSWSPFSKKTTARRRIHPKSPIHLTSRSTHKNQPLNVFPSSVFDPTFPWPAMGPHKSLAAFLDKLDMVVYLILSGVNALVCLILIPRISKRSENVC